MNIFGDYIFCYTVHYGRLGDVGILDHYNLISTNWLIEMLPDFQHKYLSP